MHTTTTVRTMFSSDRHALRQSVMTPCRTLTRVFTVSIHSLTHFSFVFVYICCCCCCWRAVRKGFGGSFECWNVFVWCWYGVALLLLIMLCFFVVLLYLLFSFGLGNTIWECNRNACVCPVKSQPRAQWKRTIKWDHQELYKKI